MTAAAKVPHRHAEAIRAFADGAQIEYRDNAGVEWQATQHPFFDSSFEYRVKSERVYPETQMARATMFDIYAWYLRTKLGYDSVGAETGGLTEVVNAAIRHACDAQQVVPMAEVQEVARNLNKRRYERAERALLAAGFEDLGGQEWKPPLGKAPRFIEVHDAAREMAIAEAVRDCARNNFTHTFEALTCACVYGRISDMNLDAIIAEVAK
jgi:hypothetical protein